MARGLQFQGKSSSLIIGRPDWNRGMLCVVRINPEFNSLSSGITDGHFLHSHIHFAKLLDPHRQEHPRFFLRRYTNGLNEKSNSTGLTSSSDSGCLNLHSGQIKSQNFVA